MKKSILFFLAIGSNLCLPAQKKKADSLAALLPVVKDTARVTLLNELTKSLWYYQLDKATDYNNEALKLAESLSFLPGIAEANRCRGVICSFRDDSTGMINLEKALAIFRQLNNKRGIAATLNNQNTYYLRQGQFSNAFEVLFQSLALFKELKDKEGIGAVTNQIGNIYRSQSDYSTALRYYLEALNIRQEIGDKPGTAFTLLRVGDMYFKLEQLTKALDYYQQSYKMSQNIGRNQNIMDAARSIGDIYLKQGKYNDALTYFNISLKAEENYFGKDSSFVSYQRIGQTFLLQKKYTPALANFQKALSIAENVSPYISPGILYSIGQVYFAQGDYSKALETSLRSFNLAKQSKSNETIKDVSLALSQIYAAINDYHKAYYYHQQYSAAKDSVLSEDLNQKLASLQQSFEIKNKQTQIDLLSRDKQLQQSEISRQKQQRYAFIAGLLLFLILALMLAISNRLKQKANAKIEKAYSELKSTQTQLIQSEKMASLGELTAGIAHEIQNPLNFVNNFSEVNKELLAEMKDEMNKGKFDDAKEIANNVIANEEKINHHGKRADAIVKGMLQHSRSSTGQKEMTDINALCDEYLRLAYHGLRAKDKNFSAKFETDFDPSLPKINVVPQEMGRVILNLINNAFYAVHERRKLNEPGYEPTVWVKTTHNLLSGGKVAEISVKDNGAGIPGKIKDKIFQPFFTTKPTGSGTGLGLSLSYDIVKAHGGEIKVDTKENKGTEFIISL